MWCEFSSVFGLLPQWIDFRKGNMQRWRAFFHLKNPLKHNIKSNSSCGSCKMQSTAYKSCVRLFNRWIFHGNHAYDGLWTNQRDWNICIASFRTGNTENSKPQERFIYIKSFIWCKSATYVGGDFRCGAFPLSSDAIDKLLTRKSQMTSAALCN